MTVEQIDAKLKELTEQKRVKLQQEKEKERREKQILRNKKRRLENRLKYILGGLVMKGKDKDYFRNLLNSPALREQDKKTIEDYLSL